MTDQNQTNSNDLWEDANDPQEMVYQHWGQFSMRPWKAALVSGVGKVPYDPAVHKKKSSLNGYAIVPSARNAVDFFDGTRSGYVEQ